MRALILLSLALAAPVAQASPVTPPAKPIVIAHRGASGYRPEHTLAAYQLAIEQGADYIEPDLVPTKDNRLVARHENDISGTTDVAAHPEFASRKTAKTIDGRAATGWFTEDFTLAELKTLRAKERLPQFRPGNAKYDGQFEIPSFEEVIALARQQRVGIYPETKHSTYFASIGHPTDGLVLAALKRAGWDKANSPVFIQSFEVNNLKRLSKLTRVKLIQLMDAAGAPPDGAAPSYAAMTTPEGLKAVAAYAYGIGPNKEMAKGDLVANAHAAGLRVHPWTFRAENFFLPADLRIGTDPSAHGRVSEEMVGLIAKGVDGFFTDFPDIGVAAMKANK